MTLGKWRKRGGSGRERERSGYARERGKKGIRTLSVRLTSNIVVLQYYIYVFNPKL